MAMFRPSGPTPKRKMIFAFSGSETTNTMDVPVPTKKIRTQRAKKEGTSTTAEERPIPEVVGTAGSGGSSGAEEHVESVVGGTTAGTLLEALSVIPRGSWGDVARRFYHDPLGRSGIVIPEPQWLWAHC
ncbi:starch synthase IIIb-2 precursor [Dorcoceras hygrometricum]|uniref:Starch synthase IIIb-2 n=1 Tax=Dorcoceras hygrometricum TaxID=472368 RepID=A0A2Z7CI21_9LAMI|nr:starch synthase IIIb-2 precursor [Dorcoceras hygrometricum]